LNLLIIVVSAILALASAVNGTTPPSGVPGVSAYATPSPTNPPARYDVIGAGGPT
jgi:hypothetical protein